MIKKNGPEILLDLMFDSGERKCDVNMGRRVPNTDQPAKIKVM